MEQADFAKVFARLLSRALPHHEPKDFSEPPVNRPLFAYDLVLALEDAIAAFENKEHALLSREDVSLLEIVVAEMLRLVEDKHNRLFPPEEQDIPTSPNATAPKQLLQISRQQTTPYSDWIPVRSLLLWFGASRRTAKTVQAIRAELDQLNYETDPDFEAVHIDKTIRLKRKPKPLPPALNQEPPDQAGPSATKRVDVLEDEATQDSLPERKTEPGQRISQLHSASTPPDWVTPDSTIDEAVSLMLHKEYSQLPVMQSVRDVKGIISWKSLGSRLWFSGKCELVRDAMETVKDLRQDAPLFDAIPLILENDCVLIRDSKKTICGIVTPSDLSSRLRELSEPFLRLDAIEKRLRGWIGSKFSKEDLQAAKDPNDTSREIKDVSNLSFGEYVRLLQNKASWEKLQTKIDRRQFISYLSEAREIRNGVMHFNADPLSPHELLALRRLERLLALLDKLEGENSSDVASD